MIAAAEHARDLGVGLDHVLGIEDALPTDARDRRDYFLRLAFGRFQVPADRANASPARHFADRIARARRREFARFKRGAGLPEDRLAAALVLALDADETAGSLSPRQLTRILDTRVGRMSRFPAHAEHQQRQEHEDGQEL